MPTFAEMQSSLLRCLFCGCDATLSEYEGTKTSGGWVKDGWTVACLDDSCYAAGSLLTWPDPLDAVKAWNKRSHRARELGTPVRSEPASAR